MQETIDLDLRTLKAGIPALTESLGIVLAEAAAVCLNNQGHSESVQLHVRKVSDTNYFLHWPTVTNKMDRAFNDLERSTELGACGIAILLVRSQTGLTAIQQSKKGTGFDYWLGPENQQESLPFQNTARLEVSGILKGTESQFTTRMKQKIKQTHKSADTKLQAYAVIVEFSHPQAEVGE